MILVEIIADTRTDIEFCRGTAVNCVTMVGRIMLFLNEICGVLKELCV